MQIPGGPLSPGNPMPFMGQQMPDFRAQLAQMLAGGGLLGRNFQPGQMAQTAQHMGGFGLGGTHIGLPQQGATPHTPAGFDPESLRSIFGIPINQLFGRGLMP